MKNTISSKDFKHVIADNLEVLIDTKPRRKPPVIGVKIDPIDAEPFIVPLEFSAAYALGEMLLRTLMEYAPELFADILCPTR